VATSGRIPTVLDWHGHSESPWYQKLLLNMGGMAERYGWLVAIPFGTADQPSPMCCPEPRVCPVNDCLAGQCLDKINPCNWNWGPSSAGEMRGADDLAFASALESWLATTCARRFRL
jgi:hypothetical protein